MFKKLSSADKKLSQDIVWTAGSFFVLAISGIVINFTIAALRDEAALGIFNLAYAVYIIASQVAVAGVHYSVLRSAAYYSADPVQRSQMLWTAIGLAIPLGCVWGLLVFFSTDFFFQIFGSAQSAQAISYAGLGLCFFPLNKVLISYINGLRRMQAFSVLQATRYILVMGWVTAIAASDRPFEQAALVFLFTELTTSSITLLYLWKSRLLGKPCPQWTWVKQHLTFGFKSLPSGMFLEVNTRVDVIVIGIFLGDREVGIYSFAAMLVDGLYHILAMVRVNINPILVTASRDKAWLECQRLLRLSKRYMTAFTLTLSGLILAAYYITVVYILKSEDLVNGLAPLIILLVSMSLISAFVPFDNLLMVSGYPTYQTIQHFIVVAVNIGLNFLLVPKLNISGAALGTAGSYFIGVAMLLFLSQRLVGWNLLSNKFSQ